MVRDTPAKGCPITLLYVHVLTDTYFLPPMHLWLLLLSRNGLANSQDNALFCSLHAVRISLSTHLFLVHISDFFPTNLVFLLTKNLRKFGKPCFSFVNLNKFWQKIHQIFNIMNWRKTTMVHIWVTLELIKRESLVCIFMFQNLQKGGGVT